MAEAISRVFKGKHLLPFQDDIDVDRIHVKEPVNVILVCGGMICSESETPKSYRDVLMRSYYSMSSLKGRDLILAEDITKVYDFFKIYNDLLLFETDLAQIVDLIILFCEGAGSLVELGAFATTEEILDRLFVVVREKDWMDKSFIRLGPLERIVQVVDRSAVCVLFDREVGILAESGSTFNRDKFIEQIETALHERRKVKEREPSTLNRERSGHIVKLIVGLVQEYGALTFGEIYEIMKVFNVSKSEDQIRGYLRCAIAVDWLKEVSRGPKDFYTTGKSLGNARDAAILAMKENAREKDRVRRRFAIRQFWSKNDKLRFSAISS